MRARVRCAEFARFAPAGFSFLRRPLNKRENYCISGHFVVKGLDARLYAQSGSVSEDLLTRRGFGC